MTDCLLLGSYDPDLPTAIRRVRRMGAATSAYKDLALSFVQWNGRPMRALEALDHFRRELGEGVGEPPLHNADFLWMNLLVIGTALHRRGHSFDYVNLPALEPERFAAKVSDPALRTVAITTTLYVTPEPILELVGLIRRFNERVAIVIGGPYVAGQAATLEGQALEDQLGFLGGDIYVISAEGEQALGDVLDALKSQQSLEGVPNIAYRRGGRFVRTKLVKEDNALATNRVDYSLFRPDDFNRFLNVRTAKSCPFACAFCGFPERAGAYTYLGVDAVKQELDRITELGVDTVYIIDDTFNVPKPRFKQMMRMMAARPQRLRWHAFYRCDQGDDEAIDLMAQAGCEGVILGIESGSDRMLRLMNKSTKRSQYLHAIPRLEAAGIACYASLIVGFPGETRESVEDSMSLLEAAAPSYYRAQLWYCDPITPIYRARAEHGIEGEGFHWRHRTMAAEEACDHIDRMLLSIERSVWMPQFGFEFWSTFYLRRRGMTKERVDDFLRAFNSGVADKLLTPSREELSPGRAASIRRRSTLAAAAPARAGGNLEAEAPHHDARRYREAEQRWREQFVQPLQRLALPIAIAGWTHAAIARPDDSAAGDAPLAFLLALAHRHDVDELGFWLRGPGDELPAPVRLRLRRIHPTVSAGATVAEAKAALAEAAALSPAERALALAIVGNPTRMRSLGAAAPSFRVAILRGGDADAAIDAAFPDGPEPASELACCLLLDLGLGLGLGLGLALAGEAPRWLAGTRLGAAATERLARDVSTVWSALDDRETLAAAVSRLSPEAVGQGEDEREVFQFGGRPCNPSR